MPDNHENEHSIVMIMLNNLSPESIMSFCMLACEFKNAQKFAEASTDSRSYMASCATELAHPAVHGASTSSSGGHVTVSTAYLYL